MSESKNSSPETTILSLLAAHGNLDAKQIKHYLDEQGSFAYSIQGIYKILHKLQIQGRLIKNKTQYSISLPWILEQSSIIHQMKQTYQKKTYVSQLIPKSKKKVSWTFTDPLEMERFRNHLILMLIKHTEADYTCHFKPHHWNLILNKSRAFKYLRQIFSSTKQVWTLIGNKTYLNTYVQAIAKEEFGAHAFHIANEGEWPKKNDHVYIDVIGDYIIETHFDITTLEAIDRLFTQTKELDDIDSNDILSFFSDYSFIRLQVKHAPKKARQYEHKFSQLFGPLSSSHDEKHDR